MKIRPTLLVSALLVASIASGQQVKCCNPPPQSALLCPPTATALPTRTRTSTFTPTLTNTPTLTPTPTNTPTDTPTSTPAVTNTFTNTPQTVPNDWSGSLLAVYHMEESDSTTRASSGSCVADCALANNGTVLKDTTAGHFAIGTAGAASDSAVTDNLSCTATTCDELNPNAKSFTWGGFFYATQDTSTISFIQWTTSQLRMLGNRVSAGDTAQCQVRDSGGTLRSAATANSTFLVNTLTFVACTFDDAADELKAYTANTASAATTATAIGNTTGGSLQVAGGDSGWVGTSDEVFFEDHEISDTDLCRICSCGVDGSDCSCTDASYVSTGNNATLCGTCTLPACNKAAPD